MTQKGHYYSPQVESCLAGGLVQGQHRQRDGGSQQGNQAVNPRVSPPVTPISGVELRLEVTAQSFLLPELLGENLWKRSLRISVKQALQVILCTFSWRTAASEEVQCLLLFFSGAPLPGASGSTCYLILPMMTKAFDELIPAGSSQSLSETGPQGKKLLNVDLHLGESTDQMMYVKPISCKAAPAATISPIPPGTDWTNTIIPVTPTTPLPPRITVICQI
ncbi:uncharacterized protein LOC144577186 [Callithrix jacchus]